MSPLEQAQRNIRAQATQAFSFDVFDTYLLRRCATPEGVYEHALRYTPVAATRRNVVEAFIQHRIQAESRAHLEASATRGSPEVSIEEIYHHFPYRLFGLDPSVLPTMVEAELRAEIDLCFANPEIAQFYDDLRASGTRVGFISDTYWSKNRLARILRTCSPKLQWDFLYPSCHHRSGKSEQLFARYLSEQRLDAASAVHIGDNPVADVKSALLHGIRAIHYPQAGDRLAAVFSRESAIASLLGDEFAGSLDGGLRTLRRLIARRSPSPTSAFALGLEVVGPIMAGFDHFVADRIDRLVGNGGRVGVAFLARDGRLAFRLWQSRHTEGTYVEINRRIAMLAAATDINPLVEFFDKVPEINAPAFAAILKTVPARVRTFFDRQPGGICTGQALAKKLPSLIGRGELHCLSTHMRDQLMVYLRNRIPDFDRLTDLVLVDLGYAGSMQKALRRVFDCEGISTRLHGLYLITTDDALSDIDDDDSAEGFLSEMVLRPQLSRGLLKNIALLEQLCSDPVGSVRNYVGGEVVREPDPRPAAQCALCEDLQEGALHFAKSVSEVALGFDPYEDGARSARLSAVMLSRLLLLPTDDELSLLGGIRHDVNLGTQALATMADPVAAHDVTLAQPLPTAFTRAWPPMWLAGSMAALSPGHGFLYAAFATGHLPADVFGDAKCGTLRIALTGRNGSVLVEASCFRTGFGDVRIKIPLAQNFDATLISVPLAHVASRGLLRGITFQSGKTIRDAAFNPKITRLVSCPASPDAVTIDGEYYSANDADGYVLIEVPKLADAAAIVAIEVTPLVGGRVMASAHAD
jgi:FMN phosphatase YigB (HAD superfamily)